MAGGVRGFVEVDDTGADVGLNVTLQRRASMRDRGEMSSADDHYGSGQSMQLYH